MKKVAVLLFLLITSLNLFAQQNTEDKKARKAFDKEQKAVNWNFILNDKKLYWQKTFAIEKGEREEVEKFFNQSTNFKKIGDKYTASLFLANYTDGNIPHILQTLANMTFMVQYKDDKYRITVLDIVWQANVSYLNVTQAATLTMQDLLETNDSVVTLKQYGCKHTNICLLNLFNYRSVYNKPNDTILNSDF